MTTLYMRKLVHFVAVAEELSFTRAAARLQMSQQALSTSIRQLERELDVTLFDRSPHHVALTEAGQALLESGRPLLVASSSALERARRIGHGELEVVRVAGRSLGRAALAGRPAPPARPAKPATEKASSGPIWALPSPNSNPTRRPAARTSKLRSGRARPPSTRGRSTGRWCDR